MVERDTLIDWLDAELDTEHYNAADGAKFNGLLVSGRDDVSNIGLCTNFTLENIESAHEYGMNLVISHHGGWERFEGTEHLQRKKDLLSEYGISWYIAHEPLDCADDYGVSAALMAKLGISVDGAYGYHAGGNVGRYGTLAVSKDEFIQHLHEVEDGYEVVDHRDRTLEEIDLEHAKIGVIGGSAGVFQPLIQATIEAGCDLLICGNSSFFGDIYAYENELTMVTMEETSSERWGVYALGEHLKETFADVSLKQIEERNW